MEPGATDTEGRAPHLSPRQACFHPEAYAEALEATAAIVEGSPGMANAFVSNLEHAIAGVCTEPPSGPDQAHLDPNTHLRSLRPFPYLLIYRARKHDVEILALAHEHHPLGYWKHRLD